MAVATEQKPFWPGWIRRAYRGRVVNVNKRMPARSGCGWPVNVPAPTDQPPGCSTTKDVSTTLASANQPLMRGVRSGACVERVQMTGAARRAELRDSESRAADVVGADVAEDAAQEQQIGGRCADAGVGRARVALDDLDAGRGLVARRGGVGPVELDEPPPDVAAPGVRREQRQHVEAAPRAQAE